MEDPAIVEPRHDYLGFVCVNCARQFPITRPLDPVQFPIEQPVTVGAQGGKIPADCPHCGHTADYTIERLIRFSQ